MQEGNEDPMDSAEEFRKNAQECARMTAQTRDPADKANWQRLEEAWRRLASNTDEGRERPTHGTSRPAPGSFWS
jgi:hypothetical protein